MRSSVRIRAPSRWGLESLAKRLGTLDYVVGMGDMAEVPPLPPARVLRAGTVQGAYRQGIWFIVQVKQDEVVVVPGWKTSGLNVKQDDADVFTGGTLTVYWEQG